MDYQKHYDTLVERGQNRTLTTYSENHHIIPRCLGGTNEASNLVRLTPEEHYVAHLLLVKLHPTSRGLNLAAYYMGRRGNNKEYGWVRRKHSEYCSSAGKNMSEETRNKIRDSLRGRSLSNETKKRISDANKGKTVSEKTIEAFKRPKSAEHRRKIGDAHIGRVVTEETRKKLSLFRTGRKTSDETKAKIAASWINRKLKDNHES